MQTRLWACVLLFICTKSLWSACGTELFAQRQKARVTQGAARSALISTTNCDAEFYYDTASVEERHTDHFQIYYVLKGPHATTERFIDSLASALENAWKLQIQTRHAKTPTGADTTWHFQKSVPSNLYPVEVLDINLIRDNALLFGGFCEECMGLTFPPKFSKPSATEIVIDNDFVYSEYSSRIGFSSQDSSCIYPIANDTITNYFTGKNYFRDFGIAIRMTAHHEFYHAVQSAYANILDADNYWFEASASAIEEFTVPEADDYWGGLLTFFSSTGTTFDNISNTYATAVLGIFNAEIFGDLFDIGIWERFSATPDSSFETVYAKEIEERNLDADSLFADFAARIFFSGSRYDSTRAALSFTEDFSKWPAAPLQHHLNGERVTLNAPAINYYKISADSMPDLSEFRGKASVALYGKNKTPRFYSLDTISIEALAGSIQKSDSAVLILSRLRDSATAVIHADTLPMRAYPNPWRGNSPLCFAGLSSSKTTLEIRTRAGKLVKSYDYQGSTFCIDAEEVFARMAPGLYFFRTGKSRAKPFILTF